MWISLPGASGADKRCCSLQLCRNLCRLTHNFATLACAGPDCGVTCKLKAKRYREQESAAVLTQC